MIIIDQNYVNQKYILVKILSHLNYGKWMREHYRPEDIDESVVRKYIYIWHSPFRVFQEDYMATSEGPFISRCFPSCIWKTLQGRNPLIKINILICLWRSIALLVIYCLHQFHCMRIRRASKCVKMSIHVADLSYLEVRKSKFLANMSIVTANSSFSLQL